jgi:hypothetical protein
MRSRRHSICASGAASIQGRTDCPKAVRVRSNGELGGTRDGSNGYAIPRRIGRDCHMRRASRRLTNAEIRRGQNQNAGGARHAGAPSALAAIVGALTRRVIAIIGRRHGDQMFVAWARRENRPPCESAVDSQDRKCGQEHRYKYAHLLHLPPLAKFVALEGKFNDTQGGGSISVRRRPRFLARRR